jgi:hypothetical protein
MINDLFNSIIYKSYSGTILLWDLRDKERSSQDWVPLLGAEKIDKPEKAILDGQQRLSSINLALQAPKIIFPNRDSYYYFFIDFNKLFLNDEDNSIMYRYYKNPKSIDSFKQEKNELIKKGLFPLCFLSDDKFLNNQEYEDWLNEYLNSMKYLDKKPTAISLSQRIQSILDYAFLTETLDGEPGKVCSIFANLNSKGLKLNLFDLMNAFLSPSNIKLQKKWKNLDNKYPNLKDVDSDMNIYILKLISLYKQNYCSSKYIHRLIPGSIIKDKDDFEKLWEYSGTYSESARTKIMGSGFYDFGAIKPKFIPNTTIIPVLGALWLNFDKKHCRYVNEQDFMEKIYKWYWCAVISGDYSGSSDSIMSQDYREVNDWIEHDCNVPTRVKEIDNTFLESLNLDAVKNRNNSRYCAILNLFALRLSKDWFTGKILGNYPLNEINDHHIFPTKSGLNIDTELVDSILNRAILHEKTNKEIQNKSPKDYYPEIIKKIGDETKVEEIMETHLISPQAIKFMQENDFENFIKERKKTVISELKRIIGLSY